MNKLSILKRAYEALENNEVEYNWKKPYSCNCGIVAQIATGQDPVSFGNEIFTILKQLKLKYQRDGKTLSPNPTWNNMIRNLCPITGMPQIAVFRVLFEAGFTKKELMQLEGLSNPKIKEKAQVPDYMVETEKVKRFLRRPKEIKVKRESYRYKENLMKYLKAWIDILEDEGYGHDTDEAIKIAVEKENYELAAMLDKKKRKENAKK